MTHHTHETEEDRLRATGRTKQLALEYLLLALRSPGERLTIRDHYDRRPAHKNLMIMIRNLAETLELQPEEFDFFQHDNSFLYKGPQQ